MQLGGGGLVAEFVIPEENLSALGPHPWKQACRGGERNHALSRAFLIPSGIPCAFTRCCLRHLVRGCCEMQELG